MYSDAGSRASTCLVDLHAVGVPALWKSFQHVLPSRVGQMGYRSSFASREQAWCGRTKWLAISCLVGANLVFVGIRYEHFGYIKSKPSLFYTTYTSADRLRAVQPATATEHFLFLTKRPSCLNGSCLVFIDNEIEQTSTQMAEYKLTYPCK